MCVACWSLLPTSVGGIVVMLADEATHLGCIAKRCMLSREMGCCQL